MLDKLTVDMKVNILKDFMENPSKAMQYLHYIMLGDKVNIMSKKEISTRVKENKDKVENFIVKLSADQKVIDKLAKIKREEA